nr:MAG TPA: hypothetical protein [Caudoviricetes sp.]
MWYNGGGSLGFRPRPLRSLLFIKPSIHDVRNHDDV